MQTATLNAVLLATEGKRKARTRPHQTLAHPNNNNAYPSTVISSHIITAGSDGDIRIWDDINDDDPTSKCVGEFVLALCQYEQRILVATDLNTVQAFTFPDGDRDGTEFRFTASVTCIRTDSKVCK